MNSILTAPANKPASHNTCGWETFTDYILQELNKDDKPKVFVFWGQHAISKEKYITNDKHLVIKAPNPSPLSAANGFYGSKPFSTINKFLVANGRRGVNWQL